MNVLQVITKGEAGGAQTHLLELCSALREQVTLSVAIGGPQEDSAFARHLSDLAIQPHFLPELVNSLSPWRAFLASRALVRLLRLHQPDLIHAHSGMAGAVARIAGRVVGVPVVYTVHGFGFKPQVPWMQRLASRCTEWLLAPWTSHMICVSSHERELARRLPLASSRISMVRNALKDAPGRADPARDPMRVIMVARCAPPKRHDLLLQALALATYRLGQPIPATLVGGGPQMSALQQQVHKLGLRDVIFTGDIDNVPDLLPNHGLFALLSDHEGLPISVIEALRCGLPILGSDLPGISELVENGQEAWLLPNEVGRVADALVSLARQPQERARMGRAARQRYELDGTPALMTRAVLAVYGQIIPHEPCAQP